MTSEHLEVERKLEADDSFVLPDLGGVDGVAAVGEPEEHTLEATYFDTPDLRLLRSRVTLRRRTGGEDAGWHVKLPAAAGSRRELHEPPGRASRTVPNVVLAPVLGLLGTASPEPVATLRTRRVVRRLLADGGAVLAEVADDTVLGTALAAAPGEPTSVTSWREVEVELVDGDEALLDTVTERLLAAGARVSDSPSKVGRVLAGRRGQPEVPRGKKVKRRKRPAGEVVLAAVATQLGALREADVAVRTEQPEGVHDLRVACRRLRSILAAFRPVLAREGTDPLREELRWVGAQLSAARDGEVALAHLREVVAAQPVELVLGPVAARLQQTALKDSADGARTVLRALTDKRYLRLLDALDALLADPPLTDRAGERAAPVLADAIRRSGKRLRRGIAAAQERAGEERHTALHEVRKAGKRVRYTAEVATDVLGEPATALVSFMKEVQEALGAAQDTVVTREYASRLGREAFAAGENAWTYGRLHGLEEARAARSEEEFWRLEPAVRNALRSAAKS